MKLNRRQSILVVLAAAGVTLLAGAGGAVATAQLVGSSNTINGCYGVGDNDRKGELRVVDDPASCRSNELPIAWRVQGPAAQQGRPASRAAAPQGPPTGRAWREQRLGSGWAALRGRPDVARTSTDK